MTHSLSELVRELRQYAAELPHTDYLNERIHLMNRAADAISRLMAQGGGEPLRPLGPEAETLAVAALYAWNNVTPENAHFEWPADFPEGSRAAWMRVIAAIKSAIASPSSNGRTPHFDCGNEGSNPSGEFPTDEVVEATLTAYLKILFDGVPYTDLARTIRKEPMRAAIRAVETVMRDSDSAERDKRRAASIQIGDRVCIIESAAKSWTVDWPDTYIVVGIQAEYQKGAGDGLNYSIATQDEIEHRLGATDGFSADDLAHA